MKLLSRSWVLFAVTCAWASAAPFGNPSAPKGGQIVVGIPSYPKHLLLYVGFDEPSSVINGLVFETLLQRNPQTYELEPALAEKWEQSKDGKTITVTLNKEAKFSDGTPLTSADVVFTWDAINDAKNRTAPIQAEFRSFESCKATDDRTVVFTIRTQHFGNLGKLAELMILPKHFVGSKDLPTAFRTKLVGSGPYKMAEVKPGERVVMQRNPDWWGKSLPSSAGMYNFDKVIFRTIADQNVAFEVFKKGEIDYFYFLSARMWTKETEAPQFQKNYIKKLRIENKMPFATQGIAWNLRRPLFQDKRVRLGLSHLFPRERLIKELMFDNYLPASGVVGTKSDWHSPKVKPVPFDPKAAVALFEQAGFKEIGADRVRFRKLPDGKIQRFAFELLLDSPSSEKHMSVYQEELRKVGVEMKIRVTDWATGIRLADDWQFDAYESARGRAVEPSDFAVTWSSREADIKGSSNATGYKNPEVDELAKKIDETFDAKKRLPMVQRIDEILAEDQPMLFAYEGKYVRVGYWSKFGVPGKGYDNYSSWRDAYHYWWYDEAQAKKLAEAKKKNVPLAQ